MTELYGQSEAALLTATELMGRCLQGEVAESDGTS